VPCTRSDTNVSNEQSTPEHHQSVNSTNQQPRRARSMLSETKCAPS